LATTPLKEKHVSPPAKGGRSDAEIQAELAGLDNLANWLDSKFEIPGTGVRFGLDPILGLLPGIGDTLSAIPAGHIILTGQRMGASNVVVAKMVGNVAVDMVAGFIPFLGDLLDLGFKANRRNLRLLHRHLSEHRAAADAAAPVAELSRSG
jgi:hypothetical protein